MPGRLLALILQILSPQPQFLSASGLNSVSLLQISIREFPDLEMTYDGSLFLNVFSERDMVLDDCTSYSCHPHHRLMRGGLKPSLQVGKMWLTEATYTVAQHRTRILTQVCVIGLVFCLPALKFAIKTPFKEGSTTEMEQ